MSDDAIAAQIAPLAPFTDPAGMALVLGALVVGKPVALVFTERQERALLASKIDFVPVYVHASGDADQITDGFHTFGELYRERAALTAIVAKLLLEVADLDEDRHREPADLGEAWVGFDGQPGFDGYRTVLYLRLPTGQVSWHFSDAEAKEFLGGIPRDKRKLKRRRYDGHDTPTKHARVEAFARGEDDA